MNHYYIEMTVKDKGEETQTVILRSPTRDVTPALIQEALDKAGFGRDGELVSATPLEEMTELTYRLGKLAKIPVPIVIAIGFILSISLTVTLMYLKY